MKYNLADWFTINLIEKTPKTCLNFKSPYLIWYPVHEKYGVYLLIPAPKNLILKISGEGRNERLSGRTRL